MGRGTVHKGDWAPTVFQASIEAKKLYLYTNKIVRNDNVFNPENDFNNSFRMRIIETSLLIFMKVWSANRDDIRFNTTTKEIFQKRLSKQADAISLCDDLLTYIEVAWGQFHLPSKKVAFWGNMAILVQNTIKKWHASDTARYKKYLDSCVINMNSSYDLMDVG